MSNLPETTKPGQLLPARACRDPKDLLLKSDILTLCGKALPPGEDPGRWWRSVLTLVSKLPQLMQCTAGSLYQGLLEIAQTGLTVGGGLGEVYLIPFKDNRNHCQVATVIYGYKGLCKLLFNEAGLIVHAREVYQADHLEYEEGLHAKLVHKPSLQADKGPVIASYAIAKDSAGRIVDFEFMDRSMLDKVRALARGADRAGSAYQAWGEMMDRKAPIRRLCNRLPKSSKVREALARETATLEAFGFFDRHGPPIAQPREIGEAPESLPEETDAQAGEEGAAADGPVSIFVANCEEKPFVNKKTKQPGKRYVVEFSDGIVTSTFSETTFNLANELGAARRPVVYSAKAGREEGTWDLESLGPAPEASAG